MFLLCFCTVGPTRQFFSIVEPSSLVFRWLSLMLHPLKLDTKPTGEYLGGNPGLENAQLTEFCVVVFCDEKGMAILN